MDVHITGRHVDVSDELRRYMERKIPRLNKYTDRLQTLEFVIEKNRFLHRAEVRLKAGIVGFTASETDRDPKRAFDLVLDKAERRLAKEMGVLNKNKKRSTRQAKNAIPEPEIEETAEEETAIAASGEPVEEPARQRARSGARKAGAGTAPAARRATARSAGRVRTEPVWLEKLGLRVFAGRPVPLESLTTEEAAERLFFEDENFLCYKNADTGALNVIYRRKDGNFAVIEPGAAE